MNRCAMVSPKSLIIAFCLALAGCQASPVEQPPLAGATIGGPFTLIDKNGKTVRWQDFQGKYRIVYFGYTFCPDACPMDVQITMRAFARFEKAKPDMAAQVQPIFITIDPERDTPEKVGEFAAAFHPRLLGLTGSPEQIAAAAKSFAAYYAKGKDGPNGYLMDHSRNAILFGRKGDPMVVLATDKGAEAVAAELEQWVK